MGLDITAYRKLTPTTASQEEIENGTVLSITEGILDWTTKFPGRSRAEGLKAGYYDFATSMRFRAGSYTGHGQWRDWLAHLVYGVSVQTLWNEQRAEGPFIELLNFADNGGIIGPKVSAKLAADFAQWQDKVPKDGYDSDLYTKWRLAFEMASDGGAVDFH